MRPYSEHRRKRDKVYAERREQVWERSGGVCEAMQSHVCTGWVECVHHIAGRGGDDPHHLNNLLGLCNGCHDYIHANPQWAKKKGWLTSRLGEVRPSRWAQ